MTFAILFVSIVILACLVGNRISNRIGVPMLLIFIVLGMFFGSDGVIRISFENFELAEQICSIALIFIMFYGGFGTKWSAAKPIALRAVILSTAGVVLTAGLTAFFCYYALHISLLESLLIGSLISSTDAASVFSILRSKRLNLKYRTASLLEVESGSNDPCSYMLTTIMLGLISGGKISAGAITYTVFAQIIYGVTIGALMAGITIFVLKKFQVTTEGFDTILVFAFVLLAYAVPSAVGGNGYLSAYLFGIVLGNADLDNKKSLVHFFDGVTGLMQMLVFFLVGLLAFPSALPAVVFPSLMIALFLTFVARPAVVCLLLTPFRSKWRQQILVSWAGLRGAASIVFAIMARSSGTVFEHDIFHMIFFIVLFSILLQGTLLPYVAKMLHMIDDKEDVLKTFTDYTEEVPVQFIQFTVEENHPWAGSKIRDILLPPETLLVQIQRDEKDVTPNGDTVLVPGDTLILSAKAPGDVDGVRLIEIELDGSHKWVGKSLSRIHLGKGKLVVMIQRGEELIIPNGNTVFAPGDTIVIKER